MVGPKKIRSPVKRYCDECDNLRHGIISMRKSYVSCGDEQFYREWDHIAHCLGYVHCRIELRDGKYIRTLAQNTEVADAARLHDIMTPDWCKF